MKIINIVLGDATGGRWKVVLDYTRVLRELGHEVTLVAHQKQRPQIQASGRDLGEVVYLRNSGHYDPIATVQAWRLLRRKRADIVIAHCSRSIALMKRAAGKHTPVVCVMHALNPKRCTQADAFINITHCIEDRLRQSGAAHKPHLHVPNMLTDMNPVLPPPAPRRSPIHIGAIGRFVRYKGFDLFMDALGVLKQRGVPFTATLAGSGEDLPLIKEKLATQGLQDRVTLPGWLPNSQALFDHIDLLCVPSRHEPFGLILLEAFNAGIPMVVAKAEGPLEICTDGVDALMAEVDSAESLASKLIHLIESPELAAQLRQAGYETLRGRYSEQVVKTQLNEALLAIKAALG